MEEPGSCWAGSKGRTVFIYQESKIGKICRDKLWIKVLGHNKKYWRRSHEKSFSRKIMLQETSCVYVSGCSAQSCSAYSWHSYSAALLLSKCQGIHRSASCPGNMENCRCGKRKTERQGDSICSLHSHHSHDINSSYKSVLLLLRGWHLVLYTAE